MLVKSAAFVKINMRAKEEIKNTTISLVVSLLHHILSSPFSLVVLLPVFLALSSVFSLAPFPERETTTTTQRKTTLRPIIFTPSSIILPVRSLPFHSSFSLLALIFNKPVSVLKRASFSLLLFLRMPTTLMRQV